MIFLKEKFCLCVSYTHFFGILMTSLFYNMPWLIRNSKNAYDFLKQAIPLALQASKPTCVLLLLLMLVYFLKA